MNGDRCSICGHMKMYTFDDVSHGMWVCPHCGTRQTIDATQPAVEAPAEELSGKSGEWMSPRKLTVLTRRAVFAHITDMQDMAETPASELLFISDVAASV